ncbi:hypothetical protein [Actinoplanes utahensis]|uniref:hypothetical protein n=1 Tax=Actinoplanes utahensis TaxID=1869 RepID=UPI00068B181C|nr:hypothetical protein [Actinoplanes utahensis]GIF31827.1 hypothetical protein Aut01nite_48130 [Actinoplanes utahensis]
MINPAEIPQIPGDMEALAGHAGAITKVGADFAGTGQRVNATWQGLAAFYRAPEAAQLFAATGPVQSVSGSVGEDIEAVGAALTAYAAEVAEIKRQLATLQSQAGGFVNSVAGDDDWREDEGKVDQHNGLIQAVNTQVAAFFEAQRRCANTINALYGGRQYRAENGDGQVQDGEYGFTAEILAAAAGEDDVLPWGDSEEHDRGFLGDVGGYFGGVGESFTNMVGDLGSLIGRDPETGGWSWSNAGNAWKGVGTFGYSLVTYSNPITIMVDQTVGMPGLDRREAGNLLLGAGKSIIAYDEWGEDNSRAAGMATFNIVSAIVGTKGAGASLRGAGTAATAVRGSAAAAKISSGLIRAGNWIDNLPSAAQIATNISNKLNIHIPKFTFGPIPAFADGVSGSGGHRFDVEMPPQRGPGTVNMDTGNGSGSSSPGSVDTGTHGNNGHGSDGQTPGDGKSDTAGSNQNSIIGNEGAASDVGDARPDEIPTDGDSSNGDGIESQTPTQRLEIVKRYPLLDVPLGRDPGDGPDWAEGAKEMNVYTDSSKARRITDVDRVAEGVLWEEKSAVNAVDRKTGADGTATWISRNIDSKISKYLDARVHIPHYSNAPIGFSFTKSGVDPAFRAAVERAVEGHRLANPGVDIRVKWS